jgi:hypothetical protein
MGTLGVGVMNSMTFSLSSNSNLKVDGKQISFGTVDFQPHPPTLTPFFASLDLEMDLTFRSLNFHVGSLGSIRLSDLAKLGLLAEKTVSAAMSDSSVGSSSEVNSPVSFTPTKTIDCTIKELDEIMENLDIEETSDHSDKGSSQNFGKGATSDFTTRNGGVSNNDESMQRSEEKYINNINQLCIIITEAAEDDDGRDNLVVNAQGGHPRNNHMKEKEKSIHIGRRVGDDHVSNQSRYGNTCGFTKRSFNGLPIRPTSAQKKLLQEKSELRRSHESNSTLSRS